MNPTPTPKRHSFRPLLLAVPPVPGAAPPTVPPPAPRARSASQVRLRVMPVGEIAFLDAQELLDELCEDQLTLSMSLTCLEESVESVPVDPAARGALAVLTARIRDLGALRDQLAAIHALSVDPRVHRLFVPDGPLADYLRGLYAWAHAASRALEELAVALAGAQVGQPAPAKKPAKKPDWALLRWRLDEAKNFHFDELHPMIRADLAKVPGGASELRGAVEQLFVVGCLVEQRLDERFC
jgi:hypothetical protein